MLQGLLEWVEENGLSQIIYYIFHVLGFAAVFAFVVWYGKKIEISARKAVLTVLIVYPIIYLWMFVMFWIETGTFGGNNIVRVFIYVPLAGYLASKLLKVEMKKMCSLLAFAPLVVHGVSHIGCVFFGCCKGYPSQFGIYNAFTKDVRFPIQFIEAAAAIAIVVYLLIRVKSKNYQPDGKEYPIMLILFGSTRFVFEFFRDAPKLIWGCSNLAFHALFMFIVGIAALIVMKKKQLIDQPSISEDLQ